MVWEFEPLLAVAAWVLIAFGLAHFFPFGRHRLWTFAPNPGLGLVRLSILASGFWFVWVFATGADAQIQGFYVVLYVGLAYASLLWGSYWKPILGVWDPADVVERGNLAAALVLAGFTLGTAFAFGGALTGDDLSCAGERLATPLCRQIAQATAPDFAPGTVGTGGWHVVMAFFLLAYVELRANVALVDRIGGGLSRQARIDRDVSAGLLLAAVAVSSGLVAGRAAAGDYHGWGPALEDYWRRLWPLLAIPFIGSVVGFATTDRPSKNAVRAAASAALVVAAALWYALT
jgi:hypothetical protein